MMVGAISKAASAAANEMSLLMGVRKDIWYVCMRFCCQGHALPSLLHPFLSFSVISLLLDIQYYLLKQKKKVLLNTYIHNGIGYSWET